MPVDISSLRPYRTAVFDNRRWAGFEPRPGDIFVCTPPKCGTTWTQAIVASLLWPDGQAPGPVMTISPWEAAGATPSCRSAATSRNRPLARRQVADLREAV